MIGLIRSWAGSAAPRQVQDMAEALRTPFGPGADRRQEPTWAAVWTRHAPVQLADGRWLLFAGTVFERASLAGQLDLGADAGDAQLYAAARDRWGDALDDHLTGTFAAVLVEPDTPRLEALRSPLQAPPLYWANQGGQAVLGSLPKVVLASQVLPRALDSQRLADALLQNHKEPSRTWFDGIKGVPLGSSVILSAQGQPETRKTYSLPSKPDLRFPKPGDYVEAAREQLLGAVRAQGEGFDRPAVSLSGGYDSQSLVYALSTTRPGAEIRGYTHVPSQAWDGIVPDTRSGSEWGAVQELAAMYPNLRAAKIETDEIGLTDRADEFTALSGLPASQTPNFIWLHALYDRARQDGADVVLDGVPGNLTFTFEGDPPFGAYLSRGRLDLLLAEAWAIFRGPNGPRHLVDHTLAASLNDTAYHRVIGWMRKLGLVRHQALGQDSYILPDWDQEMSATDRLQAMNPMRAAGRPRSRIAHRQMILSTPGADRDALFQAIEAMHGVAVRQPLLHRPLVEFFMRLPYEQFFQQAQGRRLAQKVLTGHVPQSVLDQRERGLQSADFLVRFKAAAPQMLEDLDRYRLDPDLSNQIDIDRLEDMLRNLPDETPRGMVKLETMFRGIQSVQLARFARFVAGKN